MLLQALFLSTSSHLTPKTPAMATLRSGVLLKLIRDMKSSSSSDSDFLAANYLSDEIGDGSAILQVTGIVPALADSDLFPDRGFYLQVSDSSHSTYVSLTPGHDDLILSDNLQLGQLILVRRLEASSPVPILHGLKLIPGRHPFPKRTAAIPAASPAMCSTICPASPERKKRQPRSANTSKIDGRKIGYGMQRANSCSCSPPQKKELNRVSSVSRQPMKIGVSRLDEESDESDKSSVITSISNSSPNSFVSMIPRPKTVRKNWEPDERMKDRIREDKPILRTRSSSFTHGDFARYNSCIPKGKSLEVPLTGKGDRDAELKTLTKRKIPTPTKVSTKNSSATIPLSTYDDMKWPDSNVLWGSLTFNLVKYGKEVLRRRDSALYAALDALQEACTLERLVRCLSTYSELQASKDGNPQMIVDKFLDFHEDLSRATLATQSLARTNSSFSQPISTSSLNAAKEASERRKCAASWIKEALKSELSRTPKISSNITDPLESSLSDRKSQSSMIRQKKDHIDALSAVSALPTLNCNIIDADLAKVVQSECNRWFLRYIEKFLDVILRKRSCKANESQIASLLCQLKRVDDWLVTISTKDKSWSTERSKESFPLEDDDLDACGRVRRKIYEILLKHVESAAMALESMSTTDEDKVVAR